MSEQERLDMESIDMVNRGKQFPRTEVHFVPEAEYRRLTAIAAEYPRLKKEEAILMEWRQRERRERENRKPLSAAGGVARGCCAVLFLVGAVQGMMDPVFAGALTLGCIGWGTGHYIRGCRDA